VPVWFSNVPHRRLVFALEHDEPRLTTTAEPTRGVPLEPGRWWFSRRMHRLTAAAGLARTATWWALFKRLSARDWVIFAERFGLPYVTGEYDERASDEDKAVLAKAAQSLGKDGSAIFSEACKLVVHEVQRSGSADGVHGSLIALCNAEISKLLAGSTLTSETGGPGSFALGRVHENRSFDLVMSDAERLAIRFEQDVGLPFVFFNGMAARPPRLKVHVVRQYDPEARMRLMSAAANELGLALDEEQVRQEFQLRRPGTGGALVGTGQRSGRSDTRSDTPRSE
jgi:phage gp29-like protein